MLAALFVGDHGGRVWKDDGVWYNYDGLIQIALGNSQFPAIIADLSRIDTVWSGEDSPGLVNL